MVLCSCPVRTPDTHRLGIKIGSSVISAVLQSDPDFVDCSCMWMEPAPLNSCLFPLNYHLRHRYPNFAVLTTSQGQLLICTEHLVEVPFTTSSGDDLFSLSWWRGKNFLALTFCLCHQSAVRKLKTVLKLPRTTMN